MKHRLLSLILGCLMIFSAISVLKPQRASAVIGSDFKPGKIIDDAAFFSGPSMTLVDIQNFLNAKVPTCDTWGTQAHSSGQSRAAYGASVGSPAPYTCLKNYVENTPAKGAESGLCNAYDGGNRSAANIIYYVSQACGVSVQTLLVTLQKEQSLITDDWPWPIQYRSAMGYGCPDTAACDTTYYGFFNQVYNAARQFKRYVRDANLFNYKAGRNNYIQYNPNSGCGGSSVYIENGATAALYNYTPYQPNAAALGNLYGSGDGCSAYGNRNFWRMFSDWFGTSWLSPAFKSDTNPTIYMNIGPYKVIAPSMAVLQDHGISAESIRTLSQASVDSVPFPPSGSGLSNNLGHIVKSPSDQDEDGGSVYLVSVGKRYQITSMDQFANFGFSESNISYLPSSYLLNLPNGGNLSNFVSSPQGAVFKVEANAKRLIFEYSTFIQQNPSGNATLLSYYLADQIPSGLPLSSRPVLFRKNASSLVYLLISNTFYPVNTYDAFKCWGLDTGRLPLYKPAQDSYVGTFTSSVELSCYVAGPAAAQNHIVSSGKRLIIPESYGTLSNRTYDATLYSLSTQINTDSRTLRRYVRSADAPAIFYLESGTKKLVPSYTSFTKLVPDGSGFDLVDGSIMNPLPSSGIKLAEGTPVKTSDNGAVFGITGAGRIAYGYNEFVGYKNSWSQIETYPANILNQSYPVTGAGFSPLIVESNTVYLLDPNGCYRINDSQLSAFNINKSALVSSQPYTTAVAWNLNLATCKAISTLVKAPNQSVVYQINNGQKRAVMTYAAFQNLAGSASPSADTVSSDYLSTFSQGSAIY